MADSSDADRVPTTGVLLGLDYGTKRIGIALSTPEQTLACPLETYTRRNKQLDALHIRQLTADYRVVGLVVGLPVHMSGDEGGKAREARAFGKWLGDETGCPVCYWDERFTSSMAEEHLQAVSLTKKKRDKARDALAAQLILQSFLDSADRGQSPPEWR